MKNEEIEKKAEEIIQLHKDNGNIFSWGSRSKYDPSDLAPIRRKLYDEGLIKEYSHSETILTREGETFTTFAAKRLKQQQNEEDEEDTKHKTKDKLETDLAIAKKVLKSYTLTRIFAWIGAITGVTALLIKLFEVFGWIKL